MKRIYILIVISVFILGVFAWVQSFNNLKNEFAGANNGAVIVYSQPPSLPAHAASSKYAHAPEATEMKANLANNFSFVDGSAGSSGHTSLFTENGSNNLYSSKSSNAGIYQTGASSSVLMPFLAGGSRKSSSTSVGGGAMAMNSTSTITGATPTMFRTFGTGEEDGFETGGTNNPNGTYNDSPVGEGFWILLILASVYFLFEVYNKKTKASYGLIR